MSIPGDVVIVDGSQSAADAYRSAAASIRRCLFLADIALEHGAEQHAFEYLLGALDDLAPELAALAAARRMGK